MFAIFTILPRQILDKILDSRFFGIMIDKNTDISILGHFVIFVISLEGGVVTTSFLGYCALLMDKRTQVCFLTYLLVL